MSKETPRVDAYKKYLPLDDPWVCFAKMTAKARELELECAELRTLVEAFNAKGARSSLKMETNTPKVNEVIGFTAPEIMLWKMTELAKDLEIQLRAREKEIEELEEKLSKSKVYP